MAKPTAAATLHLAEGTGTRSFTAQATNAGDWLATAVLVQDDNTGTFPVSETTLGAFSSLLDTGTGTGSRGRILWAIAKDAAGGTRTVTVTPSVGTQSYRAWLTVARGSPGPGNAAGIKTSQTISFRRDGYDSMLLVALVDWSTGAVGTVQWIPGGATVASQQGTNATYIVGRWDGSGQQGTALTGSNGTAYVTPAVAVLEILGTGDGPPGGEGPQVSPLPLPQLSYDPMLQGVIYPMRPWQRRFQWVTQPWLGGDDVVVAGEDHALVAFAGAGSGVAAAAGPAMDAAVLTQAPSSASTVASRDAAAAVASGSAAGVADVLSRDVAGVSLAGSSGFVVGPGSRNAAPLVLAGSSGAAQGQIAGAFDFQLVAVAGTGPGAVAVFTHAASPAPLAHGSGSVVAAGSRDAAAAVPAGVGSGVLDVISRTIAAAPAAHAAGFTTAILTGINDHLLTSLAGVAAGAVGVGAHAAAVTPAAFAGPFTTTALTHTATPLAALASASAGGTGPAVLVAHPRIVLAGVGVGVLVVFVTETPAVYGAAHLSGGPDSRVGLTSGRLGPVITGRRTGGARIG